MHTHAKFSLCSLFTIPSSHPLNTHLLQWPQMITYFDCLSLRKIATFLNLVTTLTASYWNKDKKHFLINTYILIFGCLRRVAWFKMQLSDRHIPFTASLLNVVKITLGRISIIYQATKTEFNYPYHSSTNMHFFPFCFLAPPLKKKDCHHIIFVDNTVKTKKLLVLVDYAIMDCTQYPKHFKYCFFSVHNT